jgi:hypothetical protein
MLKLDTKLLYACKSKELNSGFVKSKTTVKEFLSNLNYNDDTEEKIEKFLNTLTSDEYTEVPEEIREQHDYQNFVVYVKLDDEETEEAEDYYNLDEEYSENMPCDNSGYCIGFSCSNYAKCKGE